MRALLALSAIIVCAALVSATPLNLHLRLDSIVESLAIGYDDVIHKYAPTDDVYLATIERPHITLYLTDFRADAVSQVVAAVEDTVKQFRSCVVNLQTAFVSGSYGMWSVENSICLQLMSDLLVNATVAFITPNQTVPDWVLKLPEPERSIKIDMVHKYGSPNVFSQFQPHVTLAYSDSAPLALIFQAIDVQPASFGATTVAVGSVGPHGTVLRGHDLGVFPIPPPMR